MSLIPCQHLHGLATRQAFRQTLAYRHLEGAEERTPANIWIRRLKNTFRTAIRTIHCCYHHCLALTNRACCAGHFVSLVSAGCFGTVNMQGGYGVNIRRRKSEEFHSVQFLQSLAFDQCYFPTASHKIKIERGAVGGQMQSSKLNKYTEVEWF